MNTPAPATATRVAHILLRAGFDRSDAHEVRWAPGGTTGFSSAERFASTWHQGRGFRTGVGVIDVSYVGVQGQEKAEIVEGMRATLAGAGYTVRDGSGMPEGDLVVWMEADGEVVRPEDFEVVRASRESRGAPGVRKNEDPYHLRH